MKVILEREIEDLAWGGLVAADPDASFYHDPVWIRSLLEVYPHFQPLYFLALDDAGRLLGGLPAVRIARTGFSQLISLPFGTYGTPLAAPGSAAPPAEVRSALVGRWFEEAGKPGVVRAHLIPFHTHAPNTVHLKIPPAWGVQERTHLVPLSEGFETLWFRRYDKENRTASRKAVRLGVVVTPAAGEEGVEVLEELYRGQYREWTGHIPYRYGLFRALAGIAGERVRIWVARQGERPVFAVLAFYYKDTVTPWVSGSTSDARSLCAGNLVHKVLIEDGCSRGFVSYNFGGSGGNAGLEAFKVAFGGVPVDYTVYFRESPWFGRLRLFSHKLRRDV